LQQIILLNVRFAREALIVDQGHRHHHHVCLEHGQTCWDQKNALSALKDLFAQKNRRLLQHPVQQALSQRQQVQLIFPAACFVHLGITAAKDSLHLFLVQKATTHLSHQHLIFQHAKNAQLETFAWKEHRHQTLVQQALIHQTLEHFLRSSALNVPEGITVHLGVFCRLCVHKVQ
jgi:hypothetical protein